MYHDRWLVHVNHTALLCVPQNHTYTNLELNPVVVVVVVQAYPIPLQPLTITKPDDVAAFLEQYQCEW
jgi:hypothetical protein